MKKIFAALLIAALCGCSRGPKDDRVTITYFTMETLPEQRRALQEMVRAFEAEHPKIRVRVDSSSAGFQKLAIRLAGGDAPDVFYYISDRLPGLVRRGAVFGLDRFLTEDPIDLSAYFPETVASGRVGGKLYLFPFHYSTDLLIYNKDLFDKAGVAYPNENWTWDEYLAAAQKLTVREGGRVAQYGTLQPRTLLMIKSFGGDCFDEGLRRVTIDSPESRRAMRFLIDLEAKHGVSPSLVQIKDVEKDDGLNLFSTGRVAMFVGRTFMLPELTKLNRFAWDVAPVPRGVTRHSRLAVGGNAISSSTPHPREAWQFVKFFSGEKGSRICAASRNCVPAMKSVADSPAFRYAPPAGIRTAIDAIGHSRPENYGLISWDEFFQTGFKPATEKILLRAVSFEEGFAEMARRGKQALLEEARLRE